MKLSKMIDEIPEMNNDLFLTRQPWLRATKFDIKSAMSARSAILSDFYFIAGFFGRIRPNSSIRALSARLCAFPEGDSGDAVGGRSTVETHPERSSLSLLARLP